MRPFDCFCSGNDAPEPKVGTSDTEIIPHTPSTILDALKFKLNASGRFVLYEIGLFEDDSFKVSSRLGTENNNILVEATPKYRLSVSSSTGFSQNMYPADMVGLAEIADYDVTLNVLLKSPFASDTLDQGLGVQLGIHNILSKRVGCLKFIGHLPIIGTCTCTLARAGSKVDGVKQPKDRASVRIEPPVLVTNNGDITPFVEYDFSSQKCNIVAVYRLLEGDVSVKMEAVVFSNGSTFSRATVSYNRDGVGFNVRVDENGKGVSYITKNEFELRVPFSKGRGVDLSDMYLRMNWNTNLIDFAEPPGK